MAGSEDRGLDELRSPVSDVARPRRRLWTLASGAGLVALGAALVGGVWSGALGSGDAPDALPAPVETPSATPVETPHARALPLPEVSVAPGARALLVPIEVRPVQRELRGADCASVDTDAGTVPAADGSACYELGAPALVISRVRDLAAGVATDLNALPDDAASFVVTLTEPDRATYSALTAQAAGSEHGRIALVVGDVVYSAPTVMEQITGGQIGIQLDATQGRSLVAALIG